MAATALQESSGRDLPGLAFIANALPMAILVVGVGGEILFANPAAEQFFDTGATMLLKHALADILPFDSPLFQLMAQARDRGSSAAEREIGASRDIAMPHGAHPIRTAGAVKPRFQSRPLHIPET